MNGARTTFTRRGYLLTALAAAVLLAASPGIASAQSVGFSTPAVTVTEGASSGSATPAPQFVDINISGLTAPGPMGTPAGNLETGLGTLTITHALDGSTNVTPASNRRLWLILEPSTALKESAHPDNEDGDADDGKIGLADATTTLNYDKNGIIRLAIIDPAGDNNWKNDMLDMTLAATATGVSNTQAKVTVTFSDTNAAPVVKFTPASIKLVERSSTTTTVTVASGDKKDIPSGISQITNALRLMPSDSKLVAVGITCAAARATGASDADKKRARPIHITGDAVPAGGVDASGMTKDTFAFENGNGDNVGAAVMQTTGATLTIEACDETMDFRNVMATLTAVESSLKLATGGPGAISAGSGLSIHVESDEEIPVVSFATTDISVDENDTTSVFLVATTMQGDEVGMADVMVSGDARVSLSGDNVTAGSNVDDYGNGTYKVSFGMSANTQVTIRAAGDESLGDGETKTATLTLTDANGATIGGDNMVTVTVRGATSVPALPLVGQLLMALFLMAGGARLYRRRNG